MQCYLCHSKKELCKSHLIPSFVYKWLKRTSATGFLRSYANVNLRTQDGYKSKMLCRECENIFNVYETEFANRIFHPYTTEELDDYGVAKGKIKYIGYKDWLLRFSISLHWRLLASTDIDAEPVEPNLIKLAMEYREIWRNFLLGKRFDTGKSDSHIVFLQNIAAAKGSIPDNINKRINYYLLRVVDGTLMYSKTQLGVYCKIGPIAIMTFIRNKRVKNANSTRIKLKGQVFIAQTITNPNIVNFLFITRPNEIMPGIKYSDKQKEVIEEAYRKNFKKSAHSLTVKASESDKLLEKNSKFKSE